MDADRPRPSPIVAWLPPVVWAAFVWGLGSDAFAHSETSRFLGPLIDWLLPDLGDGDRRTLLYAVRKLAHPGEYAVLAILLLRAITISAVLPRLRAVACALLPVVLLAIADELRQALSTARTGSPIDVALDLAGAGIALAGVLLYESARGRRVFAPPPPASET